MISASDTNASVASPHLIKNTTRANHLARATRRDTFFASVMVSIRFDAQRLFDQLKAGLSTPALMGHWQWLVDRNVIYFPVNDWDMLQPRSQHVSVLKMIEPGTAPAFGKLLGRLCEDTAEVRHRVDALGEYVFWATGLVEFRIWKFFGPEISGDEAQAAVHLAFLQLEILGRHLGLDMDRYETGGHLLEPDDEGVHLGEGLRDEYTMVLIPLNKTKLWFNGLVSLRDCTWKRGVTRPEIVSF
uniref:ORF52 n=1 Tax=Latid herpesvirus 1 TaxID=3096545 RepID=A0AB33V6K1_9VIRU